MKNKQNLSYKKVKFIPNNIGVKKLNCIRAVFAFNFVDILDETTLVINISHQLICILNKIEAGV